MGLLLCFLFSVVFWFGFMFFVDKAERRASDHPILGPVILFAGFIAAALLAALISV